MLKNFHFSVISKLLFVTKIMQNCDKTPKKKIVCLSAKNLTGTKFPQKRKLIEPDVNAAVINTSIPAN